jgi:ATP-dependent RNA helicase DDX18/HAS1
MGNVRPYRGLSTFMGDLKESLFTCLDPQNVATAEGIEQGYVVCPSETRFLLLFTFLKKNLNKKVIVFMSSCNSVKFHAELLNYIDIPVMDLHGRCVRTGLDCLAI